LAPNHDGWSSDRLSLVPRQDSGDSKERLARISKKGNTHFRNLKADMERYVSTVNFQ